MTLPAHEFIRRFLIHVLPGGFHRIRHYGLFANGSRADNIARARELLSVRTSQTQSADANAANADEPSALAQPCPCCGGRMSVIERFERGSTPRYRPTPPITIRIDTS
jgi:Putative transposase